MFYCLKNAHTYAFGVNWVCMQHWLTVNFGYLLQYGGNPHYAIESLYPQSARNIDTRSHTHTRMCGCVSVCPGQWTVCPDGKNNHVQGFCYHWFHALAIIRHSHLYITQSSGQVLLSSGGCWTFFGLFQHCEISSEHLFIVLVLCEMMARFSLRQKLLCPTFFSVFDYFIMSHCMLYCVPSFLDLICIMSVT